MQYLKLKKFDKELVEHVINLIKQFDNYNITEEAIFHTSCQILKEAVESFFVGAIKELLDNAKEHDLTKEEICLLENKYEEFTNGEEWFTWEVDYNNETFSFTKNMSLSTKAVLKLLEMELGFITEIYKDYHYENLSSILSFSLDDYWAFMENNKDLDKGLIIERDDKKILVRTEEIIEYIKMMSNQENDNEIKQEPILLN